jgi:hypothetical protein
MKMNKSRRIIMPAFLGTRSFKTFEGQLNQQGGGAVALGRLRKGSVA